MPLSAARRRLAFAVVLTASVAASLIFAVMPPLLPAMAQSFGGGRAGVVIAQMALTMPSLGWLICGGLSGWLLARLGMRTAIILSLIGIGLFGSVAALLGNVVLFGASRFATGFSAALLTTACLTLLAGLYDEQNRAKMVGYFMAVTTAGTLPIQLASGAIAHHAGWRASMALFVLFGVVSLILALAGTPVKSVAGAGAHAPAGERAGIVKLLPILVLIFFLQIPTIMPIAQFPFVLQQLGVHEPTLLGLIMGTAGLVMSIGAIASGYLTARFGSWVTLLIGLALTALGYIGIGLAGNWPVAAACNVIGLIGGAVYLPLYFTWPLSRVSPAARASAVGLAQSAMYLSATCNPLILAPVQGRFGLLGTYFIVAVSCAIGVAVGALILLRNHRRHAALAKPAIGLS